ncbi:hypothetical protein SNE40_021464 [Patella caerulea]|uniref:Tetratricopeptide repeat protein 32 n=1 Tax=Patella caerulea TaxID=87958 RepID=A0AAN8IXJ9_PATCE
MEDQNEKTFYEAEYLESHGQEKEAFDKYSDFIEQMLSVVKQDDENVNLKIRSKLALAYNNRGYLRYLKVDFDEAIVDYTAGLKFDPKMHFSYYNRGLIHYRLGRFEEAIQDMKKCVKLKPDFEPAQQCLKQSIIDNYNKQHKES